MDKLAMCRICLAADVQMYLIGTTHLQKTYEDLTMMPFKTEDCRPIQVCYMCCARLQNCFQLRKTCLQSEELFTQMLNTNVLQVQASSEAQRLRIAHPVVQLTVGPQAPKVYGEVKIEQEAFDDTVVQLTVGRKTPTVYGEVKIEQEAFDDYIAPELDAAELDYNAVGLGSMFAIAVDIVKEDPDGVGTGALDLEEPGQATQKKYEDTTPGNLKRSGTISNIQEQKSGTKKLKVEGKPVSRNKTHVKLQRYKENPDHNYAQKNIADQSVNSSCHNRKQYSCDICQKSCKLKSHLTIHIRSHTGERPYQCNVCKKSFVQNNDLVKHMRIHTGEKPYQCNVCKKCFNQKSSLAAHDRTHTGEKPFQCDVCEKLFGDKSTLRGHVLTHGSEKPYQCVVCEKKFLRPYHLKRHLNLHTIVIE